MAIVGDVGDIARSKIDNGDAGSSGDAVGRRLVDGNEDAFGGCRNGLMGDRRRWRRYGERRWSVRDPVGEWWDRRSDMDAVEGRVEMVMGRG
jgi:hypothetical protein